MEANTPSSKSHRNKNKKFVLRFRNKIILGSKPCAPDVVTKRDETKDTPTEQFQRKHDEERNSNAVAKTSSADTVDAADAACQHCDKVFPDNIVLLKHLLKVAAKCNSNDGNKTSTENHRSGNDTLEKDDEDHHSTPSTAHAVKRGKKQKSVEIDQEIAPKIPKIVLKDCIANTDSDLEEIRYLHKCRYSNEDFPDYPSARVHRRNAHTKTKGRQRQASDEESQSDNENNEDESERRKTQKRSDPQNYQTKSDGCDDIETNRSSQRKLKRKTSLAAVTNKKFKASQNYDEEEFTGEEPSSDEDNTEVKVAKLFKCPCGVHYTSQKAIQKHVKVCYASDMSKQNCSKCGILFPTHLLVDHLCRHHSNSNNKFKFEVVNVTPSLKMYKCEICHSMFYDKADLSKHIEECNCDSGRNHSYIASKECSDPKENRLCLDNINKAKLSREESKEKEATTNKARYSLPKDKVTTNVNKQCIYKCYKCDIHYLKLPSIRYHFKVKHELCAKTVACEFCGLNFSEKSKKNHIYLHHQKMKCELKDLQIEVIDDTMNLNGMIESQNRKADPTDHGSRVPKKKKDEIKKTIINTSLPEKKKKLYKSNLCPSHFLTKHDLYEHMNTDHKSKELCTKIVEDCKICGYAFSFEILPQHILEDHFETKLKREDFRIISKNSVKENSIKDNNLTNADLMTGHKTIPLNNVEEPLTKKRPETPQCNVSRRWPPRVINLNTYTKCLYKCRSCPLHFIKCMTLYRHVADCNPSLNSRCVDCEICGLKFRSRSLKRHLDVHHKKMKLNREDFIITQLPGSIKKVSGVETTETKPRKQIEKILQTCNRNLKARHYNLSTKKCLDSKSYNTRRDFTIITKQAGRPRKCVMTSKTGLHNTVKRKRGRPKKSLLPSNEKSSINAKDAKNVDIGSLRKCVITSETGLHNNVKRKRGRPKNPLLPSNEKSSINAKDAKNVDIGSLRKYVITSETGLHNNVKRKRGRPKNPLLPLNEKSSINAKDAKNVVIGSLRKCVITSETGLHNNVKRKRGRPKKSLLPLNEKSSINAKDAKNVVISSLRKCVITSETGLHNNVKRKRERPKKSLPPSYDKPSINAKDAENSTLNSKCLYRCNICLLHFMQENILDKHLLNRKYKLEHGSVLKAMCPICRLNFGLSSLSRHKRVHHVEMKLAVEDFTIKSKPQLYESETETSQDRLKPEETTKYNVKDFSTNLEENTELKDRSIDETESDLSTTSNKKYSNSLYKCHTCFLHFMGTRTYYKHVAESAHTEVDGKCDVCGLFFSRNIIDRHKEIHHKILKLNRQDFRIVNQHKETINRTVEENKTINVSHQSITTSATTKSNHNIDIQKIHERDMSPENYAESSRDKIIRSLNESNDNTNEQEIHVKDTTPKTNTESSRNKIKMALDTIESSTDDINTLRNTIAALSENRRKLTVSNTQRITDLNNLPKNVTSLKEDVTITGLLNLDMDSSKDVADSPGIEALSRNRRMSTNVQICGNVTSINVTEPPKHYKNRRVFTELSRQHMETPSVPTGLTDKLDSSRSIDVFEVSSTINATEPSKQDVKTQGVFPEPQNKINQLRVTSVKSSPEIVQSSIQNPIHNSTEDNINQEDSEIFSNMPHLLALSKKHTLNDILKSYGKNLYKCEICSLYFTRINHLQKHIYQDTHDPQRCRVCSICKYTFSSRSMGLHKDIHHTLLNLRREDFNIETNHRAILESKLQKENEKLGMVANETRPRVLAMNSDKDENNVARSRNKTTMDSKYQFTLFKCGICNVYFIKHYVWIKHTSFHVPLRDEEYTECKLCGFQFTTYSLHKHIKEHHKKDFKMEEVLIIEYLKEEMVEKIQTYCVVDKLQSKRVSTTTETAHKTIATSVNVTEHTNKNNADANFCVNVQNNQIVIENVQEAPINDAATTVADSRRNEEVNKCDTTNDGELETDVCTSIYFSTNNSVEVDDYMKTITKPFIMRHHASKEPKLSNRLKKTVIKSQEHETTMETREISSQDRYITTTQDLDVIIVE